MNAATVTVSPEFRKQTLKAMLAIVLFIVVYLGMFALSLCLTWVCGWLAIMIVAASPGFWTLCLGLGIFSMGLMVTYFLLKFIFSRHRSDLSHLTEVTREEEPQLFAMIEEIVREVNTSFPKKIYLSADVNAAVFYDSSFWSMFLPIRKNLQIGLGLVNSQTRQELKAVLAHEFGHFSQRSMKLGSYVYNVNRVIHDMLYNNESYQQHVSWLANVSGFIALFAHMAIGIVQGIQGVFRQVYYLLNVTYMGLSREMEFHADAVAASVAGSRSLCTSLRRLNLADEALSQVLEFYRSHYQQSLISPNIYREQRWVMEYLSQGGGATMEGGLPFLSAQDSGRYARSKLVIKNQWASHPSMEDRIAAVDKLNVQRESDPFDPANGIFTDILQRQETFTSAMFAAVTFPAATILEDFETFMQDYRKENPVYLFPEIFNGYYDRWNPAVVPEEETAVEDPSQTPAAFFSDEMTDLANSFTVLERDKALLHELTVVEHQIKTFDYDGVKYSMNNIYTLKDHLDAIIAENRARLKANDAAVHAYFRRLAAANGKTEEWNNLYHSYACVEKQIEERADGYNKMLEAIQFMRETLPYAQIELRLPSLKEPEKTFKTQLAALLKEEAYLEVILPEQKELLEKYIADDRVYFSGQAYDDEAVQLLYDVLGIYPAVLSYGRDNAKLALLECSAQLMEQREAAVANV